MALDYNIIGERLKQARIDKKLNEFMLEQSCVNICK